MVSVLLYAYCMGERSSRRIERRCTMTLDEASTYARRGRDQRGRPSVS
jgi:hypothetical protein